MKTLIIGASKGIGLEMVRQYGQAGAQVIATARSAEGINKIQALGAQALTLDVANPASVSGLARMLDGEKIDLAIYVAGVYCEGDATASPSQAVFDNTMHANVLGAMQVIPQVAPLVEAAKGKFIFISSEMGCITETSSSFGWTYRVSKAALNMAVVAAQHDYPQALMQPLHPGWVRTDMGGSKAHLSVEESVTAMRSTIDGVSASQRGKFLNYDGRAFSGW
jgi:NAD(P)-dependent dehydrogenase (short-subunit alcohol dehydrogenase family)